MSDIKSWSEQAAQKIKNGIMAVTGREGKAMAAAVSAALIDFCGQDAEFAQAVVQGGTFAACMADVANGVKGGAISDLDAYKRAVRFYFPGADVRVKMTIDLVGDAAQDAQPERTGGIILNLEDYL